MLNQNNFMPDNFSVLPTEWTYKHIFSAIFTLLLKNSASLEGYAGLDLFLVLRVFLHEKKKKERQEHHLWLVKFIYPNTRYSNILFHGKGVNLCPSFKLK